MGNVISGIGEPANLRVRDAAVGLAILLTWTLAGPHLAMSLLGRPLPPWISIVGFLVGPLLFLLLYPFWAAHRCGAGPLLAWPGAGSVLREAIVGIGAGAATMAVLGGVELALFGKWLDLPEPLRQLISAQNALVPILMGVLALTVIPIAEEVFYRGLVYGALRRWSVPAALVAQAMVFALAHQYGLVYSAFVFAGGMLLGLVYEWRRTLWAPIFMHLTCAGISVPLLVTAYVAYGNTPALGVVLESHDDGCLITRVIPESSAEEAGLKAGDIVISLNEQATPSPRDLIVTLAQCEVGSEVQVEIIRRGRRTTLNVTLSHRRR